MGWDGMAWHGLVLALFFDPSRFVRLVIPSFCVRVHSNLNLSLSPFSFFLSCGVMRENVTFWKGEKKGRIAGAV